MPKVPGLEPSAEGGNVPKVSDIIDKIQEEVRNALIDSGNGTTKDDEFAVTVQLVLDVSDTEGLNPSLSYIDLLKRATTKFTTLGTGQATNTQHRNVSYTFTMKCRVENMKKARPTAVSFSPGTFTGLKGDIGIADAIKSGLQIESDAKFIRYGISVANSTNENKPYGALPSFGTIIEFTVLRGLGVSPGWSLIHFSGPGPGSGSFFNYSKQVKDTLTISITQVPPSHKAGFALLSQSERESDEGDRRNRAIEDSRSNLQLMLLQRLAPQ